MTATAYHHSKPGRNLAMILGLCGSAGFLLFGLAYAAPWWWYPPVLFAVLVTGYSVLLNPQSGMQLDAERMQVFSGGWRRTVDLAHLSRIAIEDWSDGPPSVTAHLRDGTSFAIPSVCLPERRVLVDALDRFGVARD